MKRITAINISDNPERTKSKVLLRQVETFPSKAAHQDLEFDTADLLDGDGLFINGHKVTKIELENGQIIDLGKDDIFEWMSEGDEE